MGGRTKGALARLLDARAGNVAIVSAAALPVIVGILALGVDWSYLGYQRRAAQADTDLAAIVAASNLADPAAALHHYSDDNRLDLVVAEEDSGQSANATDGAPARMTYTVGHYEPAPGVDPDQRFVSGGTPSNAVRVTLRRKADLAFAARFMAAPTIRTEAIAGNTAAAAFSVGSRLASLNGGVLNALLGGLLGTTVSLDVMDYNALVNADVDAFSFLGTAATRLHLTAVTYDDVLKSQVAMGDFLSVLADTQGLSADVSASLRKLSQATGTKGGTVDLSALLDLGAAGSSPIGAAPTGLTASASVFDLLTAAAGIANGAHQIALSSGLNLPGLAGASVQLAIGEPPQGSAWFAVGGAGTLVRTAQTRLRLDVTIGGSGLLSAMQVHLPLSLQIAYAEATLDSVACTGSTADTATATVAVRPGVVEAWIGDGPSDIGSITSQTVFRPASLISAPLLTVKAYAHTNATNTQATLLRFSSADIRSRAVRSTSTQDTVSTLLGSLFGDLHLSVNVGGIIPLGTPDAVGRALGTTLAAATAPLDTLVNTLLAVLGVKIGEADVRVTGATCGQPVLVQ